MRTLRLVPTQPPSSEGWDSPPSVLCLAEIVEPVPPYLAVLSGGISPSAKAPNSSDKPSETPTK